MSEIRMHPQKKDNIITKSKVDQPIKVNKEFNKAQASSIEFRKCIKFLNDIGIITHYKKIEEKSFLSGLAIVEGSIIIDEEALHYPGDILHEAGHIAVVPADERHTLMEGTIEYREQWEAEEMMAIAWSYAACLHLNIDPLFVFHDAGYNGGGGNIAESFKNKQYFGVPMLQWIGLTYDEKNAKEMNSLPYPHMIKWMRD